MPDQPALEPTDTDKRLAEIKQGLIDNPRARIQTEAVAWVVDRAIGSRAMYRERFCEGLTQAQWHARHCVAARVLHAVKDLHHETVESAPHRVNQVCAEDGKAWPCDTARAMGVTS